MLNKIPGRLKQRLSRILGRDSFIDDPANINVYSYDSSLQTGQPDLVVFPATTQQVAEIISLLHSEGVPYVARGAGTNLSGGSIAARGGVIIALSRMREILEIDPAGQFARVQPGVTNLCLQEALKTYGFFFAPDPASQRVSTIGGNIAENSGGPHCLKYGVTTNHILGLKLVAPNGEIIELGGARLYSPGLDLLGLFIGSEGTLGIATEITCRVLPLPRAVRTMLAVYNSTEDAGQTVSDIIAAGILPATLEMMDNLVIRAVEEALHAGYPTDAGAVLIIEVDGMEEALGGIAHRIETICRRNNVRDIRIAKNEGEREILWKGRRGAFGAVARLFPNYSVSDGTVPRTKLPEVLRQVSEIGKKFGLPIGNVFHAGDGNLHPLIFFDARDHEQLERVHQAGAEILKACAAAGGTISGEHGVGCEKINAMPLVFGPHEMQLMRRIKQAIDPADLCNPGKILPAPDAIREGRDGDCPKATGTDSIYGNSRLLEFRRMVSVPRAKEDNQSSDTLTVPIASNTLGKVPLYFPENVQGLSAVVAHLHSEKKSIAAVGAGTFSIICQHLTDALISTTRLNTIIEHDAANLTVTAEAGISLGGLQEALRVENQFLPLDAPPSATLGGIIAAGIPGPRRFLYGAPRDLMLGLKFVDASGKILKAGGKTVKNVAGYDYGKLLIGSWGTLGIISEITLRLLPLMESKALSCAGFERFEDACEAGAQILAAGLNPTLLTLINQKASATLAATAGLLLPPQPYVLLFGAEGFERAVDKQMEEMERICLRTSLYVSGASHEDMYDDVLAAVTRLGFPSAHPNAFLSLCLSFPVSATQKAKSAVRQIGTDLAVSSVAAHLAAGIVFVHFLSLKDIRDELFILERLVEQIPGVNIVVLAQKLDRDNQLEPVPFIINNRPCAWQQAIKTTFDPENLLQPGIVLW